MKTVRETKTPDGIPLCLVDWEKEEDAEQYGYAIHAYPVAVNSTTWVKKGEPFLLLIFSNRYKGYTNAMVQADFEALESGIKKLEDLSEHFWYHDKDMYRLGMIQKI